MTYDLNDAIQYRGVMVPVPVRIGGSFLLPRLGYAVRERTPEEEAARPAMRWLPVKEERIAQKHFKARPPKPRPPKPAPFYPQSHRPLPRPDRSTVFIPMERGAQIVARLRAMGMCRIDTGLWRKPTGRLREVRFFSTSWPHILKFKVECITP